MVQFVFKFLCILFITEAVSPRSLSNNFEKEDKIDDELISELLQQILDKKNHTKRVVNVADLSKMLANVTEKVALLKHQIDSGKQENNNRISHKYMDRFIDNFKAYGNEFHDYTTFPSIDKVMYSYQTKKTTTEMPTVVTEYPDYLGTAQLEELLNDIKARAIEMVAENPTVSDLITNTVTEATFEADTILNHLDISSPGYALTTFVFLSDIDNIDKRTAKDSDVVRISNKNIANENEKHQMVPRWCDKGFAQTLEDILQAKLKSAYNKVKTKVTNDFDHEMSEVKATLEKQKNSIIEKLGKPTKPCPKPKKPCTTKKHTPASKSTFWKHAPAHSTSKATTKPTTTTKPRKSRADTKRKMKKNQKAKSTAQTEPTKTMSTVDDFAMLTLYEQILSKTHESNVMDLLATNNQRTHDVTRLCKRNPETLTDLILKNDMKRKYDDEDNMPDSDANFLSESEATSPSIEDTSYQALRDKIAFKEYVNGYKSYLDFQKEHGNSDKFSNLVKYQAHKHHKVEDIGKFILDKIPPVPNKGAERKRRNKRKRHFFDELDQEEQDVSTKSDDSWFKKHFYMFIENNPPSKYRTSETVKFKEITDGKNYETPADTITNTFTTDLSSATKAWGKVNEINLDDLSRDLESGKSTNASEMHFLGSVLPTTKKRGEILGETRMPFRVYNPVIMSKLFGKRKNPTKDNIQQNKSPNYNDDRINFDSERRRKRSLMTTVQKPADNIGKTVKTKTNKDGYVTLVTQPTAIVNLLKTKVQGGKIQKLLGKLHFHKNKKKRTKMKKEKRYCTRVQRFNPIKKLREMFALKDLDEPNEVMVSNKNMIADYDMITSHIDTFKAVRYDKVPSMEELQKQIPNISDDLYGGATEHPGITKAMFVTKADNEDGGSLGETMKNSAVQKPLLTPKTFTVVLDPYPLHIKTEQVKALNAAPETKSEVDETTSETTKDIEDSNAIYTDYLTPFYDLFNQPTTKPDFKIELQTEAETFNDRINLHNAKIKAKIDGMYKGNRSQPYYCFTTLQHKAPEPTSKHDHRQFNAVVELTDEQEEETDTSTKTPLIKRTPFFSLSNNVQPKLNETNLFVDTSKNLHNKQMHTDNMYTHGEYTSMPNTATYATLADYYNDMFSMANDSYTINDNLGWHEATPPATEYTTKSVNDMQKELLEMVDRLTETDHKVRFINHLNEYEMNKNMFGLKTDLSLKYTDEELEDLVRELNKIYMRRMNNLTEHSPNKDGAALKTKYARNIVKNRNIGNAPVHPVAKVNKQPKQLFNTPLPMRNAQFEKFLKDNKIDVASVTSNLPLPFNSASNEPKTNTTKSEASNGTKETDNILKKSGKFQGDIDDLIDKSYPENQIKYLNDLEQELVDDYNDMLTARRKRNTPRNDKGSSESLIGRTNYYKAKHHMSSFKNTPKSQDVKMEKLDDLNKVGKPNDEVQITIINFDDTKNEEELVTEPMNSYTDILAQNFTNILINALKTLQSKSYNSIDSEQAKCTKAVDLSNELDPNADEIERLPEFGLKTKAERRETPVTAQDLTMNPDSDSNTNSKLALTNGKQILKCNTNNTRHNVNRNKSQTETELLEIVEVVKAVDDFTRPDVAIHIGLPVYYEPNHEILTDDIVPLKKPSWTDLVIKYVSGIALIEMLNKLGILRGGLNLTDNIDLNFDRFKVSAADGADVVQKSRAKRTAQSSPAPMTYAQAIRFMLAGDVKSKNKRMFGLSMKSKMKTMALNRTQETTKQMKKVYNLKLTTPHNSDDNNSITDSSLSGKDTLLLRKDAPIVIKDNNVMSEARNKISTSARPNKFTTRSNSPTTMLEINLANSNDTVYDLWEYKNSDDDKKTSTETKETDTLATDTVTEPVYDDVGKTLSDATYKILKRDVDGEKRVAKGVAALEIIVDLMRHKNYDDSAATSRTTDMLSSSDDDIFTYKPGGASPSTNSIQVHIAIPYDDNGLNRKRSAEPIIVRKVFSAKLATPVDLEYQIHYIDNLSSSSVYSSSTTISAGQDEVVSPGLYLLVDNLAAGNNSFALKPVKISSVNYDAVNEKKVRNASIEDDEGLTLSKEFLKAVNKHLVELYKNMTAMNSKRTVHKRETTWKKVKQMFDNDRACDCKCKENEPMCGVCAASDEVIKELTFEFNNLAKYMSDHCTEIQTYFKVNPRGGKVLRDCIRKLDKSLDDYNNRSRGKCHGPTCKMFASYLHKREANRNSKPKKVNFVNYVKSLNNDFHASSNCIPYVDSLKSNGENFIRSARACLMSNLRKRECRDAKRKDDVYTFDNISVKFICSPESSSESNNLPPFETSVTDFIYMDYGFNKRSLKPNILTKLFKRKNKKTYNVDVLNKKRQINQLESPLIADTGGSFWHDYLLRKTTKPEIMITVVQSKDKEIQNTEMNKQRINVSTPSAKKKADRVTTTEGHPEKDSYNVDDLLNLIAQDQTDAVLEQEKLSVTSRFWLKKKHTTKPANKKTEKLYKDSKAKMHGNQKNTMSQLNTTKEEPTKPKIEYKVSDISNQKLPEITAAMSTLSILTQQESTPAMSTLPDILSPSTRMPFLKKIKMATANFLKKIVISTEGYELDLDNFMRDEDQRQNLAEEKSLTKRSTPQEIFQMPVNVTGKPRFVVVTKPLTLHGNKMSNYKSMVLSLLNMESNKAKKKLCKEKGENLFDAPEKDTLFSPKTIDKMKKLNNLTIVTTEPHPEVTCLSYKPKAGAGDQVEDEKPLQPNEPSADYDVLDQKATAEPDPLLLWQNDPRTSGTGNKPDGFFAKNLKLVLRPSVKTMTTFVMDSDKDHAETTKTTEITDATLANVEEADPFKTRIAMNSKISTFVPKRATYNMKRQDDIDRRITRRQTQRTQRHNRNRKISRDRSQNVREPQNIRIYRKNSRKLNGVEARHEEAVNVKFDRRPAFDTYVRGDHGDYRIKRDRRTSSMSHGYLEKKMRKRSSSKVHADLSSLSGRIHHLTTTILCFYAGCAAFAAAVSLAYRK